MVLIYALLLLLLLLGFLPTKTGLEFNCFINAAIFIAYLDQMLDNERLSVSMLYIKTCLHKHCKVLPYIVKRINA